MRTPLDERQERLFVQTFATPTGDMLPLLKAELDELGYETKAGKMWLYGKGNAPILLVAHVDTVHKTQPTRLCTDGTIVWASTAYGTCTGLGADDRAGVWAIRELLARGLRPHVLYTDEEETGCKGARQAALELRRPDVFFMVEVDRRNGNEMIFYQCPSEEARRYVGKQGFKEETGSFTDISVLGPAWNLAAVNLSAGYYRAHSSDEHVNVFELLSTTDRVGKMIQEPPDSPIVYMTKKQLADLAKKAKEEEARAKAWHEKNKHAYPAGGDYGCHNGRHAGRGGHGRHDRGGKAPSHLGYPNDGKDYRSAGYHGDYGGYAGYASAAKPDKPEPCKPPSDYTKFNYSGTDYHLDGGLWKKKDEQLPYLTDVDKAMVDEMGYTAEELKKVPYHKRRNIVLAYYDGKLPDDEYLPDALRGLSDAGGAAVTADDDLEEVSLDEVDLAAIAAGEADTADLEEDAKVLVCHKCGDQIADYDASFNFGDNDCAVFCDVCWQIYQL